MINSRSNVLGIWGLLAGLLICCPTHAQSAGNQDLSHARSADPDFSAAEPPVADPPETGSQPAADQAPTRDNTVQQGTLPDTGGGKGTASATDALDNGQPPPGASPTAPLAPGVVVNQLGSVDGPVVGLLDDSNGGLGSQMWSGAVRSDLENELSRIPIVTTDPVVRDLARRLLLTRADAPVGTSHKALVTIRLQKLLDGGLVNEAGALAAEAAVPNDPEFARVQAEALLYASRAEVCSDMTNARLSSSELFWLELRAFCFARAGDAPAADLTRSIIEAEGTNDGGFATLIDDVEQGRAQSPGQFAHPSAVDIYMLQKLGLPVTTGIAAQLGTAANLIALRDPRNAPIERLSAAEHIVRTGAPEGVDLVAIADAQAFSSEQKEDALGHTQQLPFLMRQALIRQALALETRPAARVALVERADPTANEEGPFHVFAELQAPRLAPTPAQPSAERGAWVAARALILGNRADAAAQWLGLPENPLTAEAALALDLALSNPDNDSRAQSALAWFNAHATAETGGWPAAWALAAGIWQALGRSVPAEPLVPAPANVQGQTAPVPIPLPFDGAKLEPGTVSKIDAAVADPSRRGEAILLVINSIGSRGPAHFAPEASIYFISTLKKLGLDDSARQLPIECLLLGPPRPANRPAIAAQPVRS